MDILRFAESYSNAGFSVVPIVTDGTKSTAGSWKAYQTRHASPYELEQWFGTDNPCGIAVVCGPISGNLLAIDFDNEAVEHFERWYAEVQRQLPHIASQLYVVETPRPGRHVWVRTESEPPPGQVLACTEPQLVYGTDDKPLLDDDGELTAAPQVLIEVRSTGNYVIAPGSPIATHPSQRPYRAIMGSADAIPVLSDSEVNTLLDIARSYTRYQPEHVQRKPGEQYQGEPRPGDVFNQHADLRQLLLQHGWQLHHSVDDVDYLTRPGKDVSAGVSATLGALRSDSGQPLLYVFSRAAHPFQWNSTYDAFVAYALLEHSGDFSTAAAAVRIKYASQVQTAQQKWQQENTRAGAVYEPFPTNCCRMWCSSM